jgi:hypothetical protein
MSSIRDLVEEFVDQLSEVVESQVVARARHTVEAALAGHPLSKGNGRLRAAALSITAGGLGLRKPRKKPPVQLCPVPGCTERAAPIFGMVCANHKDVPKTKIRQYREERRAGKLGAKSSKSSASAKSSRSSKPSKASKASMKGAAAKAPARKAAASKKRPAASKAKARRATPTPAKVEVMQKPAQVRAGAATAKIKAKRLTPARETPPATLAPTPAPAPASV